MARDESPGVRRVMFYKLFQELVIGRLESLASLPFGLKALTVGGRHQSSGLNYFLNRFSIF
jgi:hypothetical protein